MVHGGSAGGQLRPADAGGAALLADCRRPDHPRTGNAGRPGRMAGGRPAGGGPYPVADARRCASPCPDARTVRRGLNSRYPLWSYPCAKAAPAVLRRLTEADLRRIEAGASALIDLPADGTECPASVRCQFSTDFWSVGHLPGAGRHDGAADPGEHPALKDYPTGTASNWQWWTSPTAGLSGCPHDRAGRPGAGQRDPAGQPGLLWEAPARERRLLVSGMDLAGHLEFPECRTCWNVWPAYLDGPAAPMAAVTPEELRRLIRVSPR